MSTIFIRGRKYNYTGPQCSCGQTKKLVIMGPFSADGRMSWEWYCPHKYYSGWCEPPVVVQESDLPEEMKSVFRADTAKAPGWSAWENEVKKLTSLA